MQDESGNIEEQALTEEPVVELIPEQVSEAPVVEPTSEPVPEPIAPEPIPGHIPAPETPPPTPEPEIVPEPEPTPLVAPTLPEPPATDTVVSEPAKPADPTPEPSKPAEEPTKDEPVIVPPPVTEPEKPVGKNAIPQKVLDLTPTELDAARRLWAMQNIKSAQAKSAHVRTARRDELFKEIEKYIKSNYPVTLSMIAYHANISPRKASDYLRILVHSNRIQATGATTSRCYY